MSIACHSWSDIGMDHTPHTCILSFLSKRGNDYATYISSWLSRY